MKQLSISLTGEPREVFRSMFDLMESQTLKAGVPKEVAPGSTLTMFPMQENRSGMAVHSPPVMEFILRVSEEIATGVVASYLYAKLSSRKGRVHLQINRRTTELDEKSITRVIEEEIDYKEDR
jgi:hypothetical protein